MQMPINLQNRLTKLNYKFIFSPKGITTIFLFSRLASYWKTVSPVVYYRI